MANGVCYVYWIHLPEHTDVFTTGYVGVTSKTVGRRFIEHVRAANSKQRYNYPIYNAIRKYGASAFIVDTVLIGDEEYCYLMESRLRPLPEMGYNLVPGGVKPPAPTGRVWSKQSREKASASAKLRPPMSEEARKKQAECKRGTKQTDETKSKRKDTIRRVREQDAEWNKRWQWNEERRERDIAARKLRNASLRPWQRAIDKSAWLDAPRLYTIWSKDKCKDRKFSRLSGVPESLLPLLLKEFYAGWVPSEDNEYLGWMELQINERNQDEPQPTEVVLPNL